MRNALAVAVATIMLATAYAPAAGLSYGDFRTASAVPALTRADFLAPRTAKSDPAKEGPCGKKNCTCGCEKGETCVCAARAAARPVVVAPAFGGYPMPAFFPAPQAFGGFAPPPSFAAPACAGGG